LSEIFRRSENGESSSEKKASLEKKASSEEGEKLDGFVGED
jgi:hypothetical protein